MNGRKICFWGMFLSFLFAILPIISFLLGSILSVIFACENVNEGSSPDCIGGDLVYILFMMMWFIFFTFPIGLIIFTIFFIIYIIIKLRKL